MCVAQRCGNDAPWKAWKTQKASFPLFPPRLEIRQKAPDSPDTTFKILPLNVRHFHEKLREEHGTTLSYTWVKLALQGAGLVKKGRKRGTHRKRRPRRPLPGMLLHLDGSRHRWFQDERWHGRAYFAPYTAIGRVTSLRRPRPGRRSTSTD